ncbi:hypothetical protein UB46_17100 [Burkholderiaceae bacterium 16]|nr:hypothetical protein UB46_17100 [Burkholderiaceae bacterium 16]
MSTAEQNVWLAAAGLAPWPEDRSRIDDPAKHLPDPNSVRHLTKGKTGRPTGATAGWNRRDREIELAMANATAKADVEFLWSHQRWPRYPEQLQGYKKIPKSLWKRWVAMRNRRGLSTEIKPLGTELYGSGVA